MTDRQREPASLRRLRRLRAAAAVHGLTVSRLAKRCGVSDSHLRAIALGDRKPSERLVESLKLELGESGWAFWRGQSDTLTVAVATGATGATMLPRAPGPGEGGGRP